MYVPRISPSGGIKLPEWLHKRLDTHEFKVAYVKAHRRVRVFTGLIEAALSSDPYALLAWFGIPRTSKVTHPVSAPLAARQVATNAATSVYNDVETVEEVSYFDEGRAKKVTHPVSAPLAARQVATNAATSVYNDVETVEEVSYFDEGRAKKVIRRPRLNPIPAPIVGRMIPKAEPPANGAAFGFRVQRMDLTAPVEPLGAEDFELGQRVVTAPQKDPTVPDDLANMWRTPADEVHAQWRKEMP